MVQIHVNQTLENQFLYECMATLTIDEVTIQIYNLQAKIQYLVHEVEQGLLVWCKEYHPNAAIALKRVLSEAKTYASKDQVLYERILSPHVMRDHIRTIEREVMVNNSVALPDMEFLNEDATQLWWAGKELARGRSLCDYVDNNEKTKL
ncbi:uncharacterized protein LOC143848302 isoform X2 [Tasmannia lanceolata]|uniref:uncharacterized protein LOC143848302 isoform X2 n=1 Tax=Tasmannia lanceolata TaxID=3420 RepID=UPI00406343C4